MSTYPDVMFYSVWPVAIHVFHTVTEEGQGGRGWFGLLLKLFLDWYKNVFHIYYEEDLGTSTHGEGTWEGRNGRGARGRVSTAAIHN